MGFGGARGRTGTGRALYRQDWTIACNAPETRKHIEKRAHVGRLFLDPDNLPRRGVLREYAFKFFFGERVDLFDESIAVDVSFLFLRSARNSWPILPVQSRILPPRRVRPQLTLYPAKPVENVVGEIAIGDDASGCRNVLLGVNAPSGLRQ